MLNPEEISTFLQANGIFPSFVFFFTISSLRANTQIFNVKLLLVKILESINAEWKLNKMGQVNKFSGLT